MRRLAMAVVAGVIAVSCGADITRPPANAVSKPLFDVTPEDMQVISANPAHIVEAKTYTDLSLTEAAAAGSTKFVGSQANMTTRLRLYKNGSIIANDSDDNDFDASLWDNIRSALGLCESYTCTHTMWTDIPPILIDQGCGHSIQAASEHRAKVVWGGYLWSTDQAQSGASKAQSQCQTGDGGSGSGGSGGCFTVATDHYWYYPDTGELEYINTTYETYCYGNDM